MTIRKYGIGFTSLLVASSLVLAACGGGAKDSGTAPTQGANTNAPATKKAPAVGGEIVRDVPADPDTLAPFWLSSTYAAYAVDRIYGNGLLTIGPDLKPAPALAEAMPTVSADQKTYTFKLRKGIKFHDGKEVTAHDIVFAYEILMSPDYKGPSKTTVAPLESVKALDDYTVEFKTKEVFAPFLFGTASVPPMPKHILKDVPVKDMGAWDGWKTKPVGAGPYKLTEWKTGQYVLLERFADYWEFGKPGVNGGQIGPFVEKLRLRVIPEANTAIAALEAGEIDFMTSVDSTHIDRLKNDYKDKLQAFDWDRMGYGYQTFNNELFPTNIKEVRQALSMALNEEAIIKGVLDNKATIPPGFIPPIHWAYDKTITGYTYNKQKAIELIEKAGFKKNAQGIYEKDGKPMKLKYVGTKGSSIVEGIALATQKDFKEIGVEVELVMVDFNTLLDKHLKPGDYHITFSGLSFTVDPHFAFDAFHSKNIRKDDKGVAQGTNRARYSNPKVDALIEKGEKTVDPNERLKIYQEAQKLIVEDAPMNWVYVNKWTDFAKKSIKGIVNINGYGIYNTGQNYVHQWYVSEK